MFYPLVGGDSLLVVDDSFWVAEMADILGQKHG
jgi:hypothetical protein